MRRPIPTLLAAALLVAGAAAARQEGDESPRSALRTVEGVVTALAERPGESDLPVVLAELELADGERVATLLAPRAVLEEIGFEVEVGDRLRVRIFADDESPARAQKVLNATRDSMIRLRTLRHDPLWSASGHWQGGAPHGAPRGPGGGQRREGRGGGPR